MGTFGKTSRGGTGLFYLIWPGSNITSPEIACTFIAIATWKRKISKAK